MTDAVILDTELSLEFELDGISLIEASAGTGKTYTIANLYLRHILAGRQPPEILVVSFTNAATDELHQRIHARLYQALATLEQRQNPADEFLELLLQRHLSLESPARLERERRIQYALRSMDEAMISTIHGFCHTALQDHALLSNRQFESEIVSNDDHYWESALKDWWRITTYPLTEPAWRLFTEVFPGLQSLLDLQRHLRQHPRDQIIPQVETPLTQLLQQHAGIDPGAEVEKIAGIKRDLRARALIEAQAFANSRVAKAKRTDARMAYQDQLDLLLEALQGNAGTRLAARLRARFPVAMIDEFQDTDRVQFDIFQLLYHDRSNISLTLIGDPKQAIYGFRGGDIFTYIEARQQPKLRIFALQTNWRSQAGLVNAVNHLFTRRAQPFIFDQAIEFSPARPATVNDSAVLSVSGQQARALSLWQLPLRDDGKTHTVGDMREWVIDALVTEIARLLNPASQAKIAGRPLESGDIAILVRENSEGEAIRSRLGAVGIGSVSIGREKVFASDEALGLYDLLEGIAYPTDERCLRRARACSLFNLDYDELAAAVDDDESWQRWVDRLQLLHRDWQHTGFIGMFEKMLLSLDLGSALARSADAERRLTNVMHLGELLQQQSQRSPGMDPLMSWMRQQMDGECGEEAELRLESDAQLVKIVTIHKSKGLEYPVVFLPFAWRCRLVSKKASLLRFHDADNRAFVDLGSAHFESHGFIAEKERLAEDLRLLYVALTRAKSKIYLAWGDAGDGRSKGQPAHTALAYLLHSRQSPEDLASALPRAFGKPAEMLASLPALIQECDDIELLDLPSGQSEQININASIEPPRLQALQFTRDLGPAWRINSFSGLTRDVHQVALSGERIARGDAILDFPAGSHIGLLLHELLEHLDFTGDIPGQADTLVAQRAPVYGINNSEQQKTLVDWLRNIVDTPLDDKGLSLRQLGPQRRLNELKFDFAIDGFDINAVNALLQQGHSVPLQPLSSARFRGLMTGIIDLVFEFDGKFYLADYKSNYLGAMLDDYRPQQLAQSMLDRRYDLQLLLYTVALHRYLGQRLPGYRYDKHFGGCYYLFLRAMRPPKGPAFGVHFERPGISRLGALERLLACSPDNAVTA